MATWILCFKDIFATGGEDTGGCPLALFKCEREREKPLFQTVDGKLCENMGPVWHYGYRPPQLAICQIYGGKILHFFLFRGRHGKLMLRCQICIHAFLKMPKKKTERSTTLGGEERGPVWQPHQRAALFWSHTALLLSGGWLITLTLNCGGVDLCVTQLLLVCFEMSEFEVNHEMRQHWRYCNEETPWQLRGQIRGKVSVCRAWNALPNNVEHKLKLSSRLPAWQQPHSLFLINYSWCKPVNFSISLCIVSFFRRGGGGDWIQWHSFSFECFQKSAQSFFTKARFKSICLPFH